VGAIAAVVDSLVLIVLLLRTGAARPLAAGLSGAIGSGRSWRRRAGGVAAALAATASPVARLFTGLAGTALMVSAGWPAKRPGAVGRGVDGLLVAIGAGAGGWMKVIAGDTPRSFTVSLVVAALVPRRAVRIGALLSAAGVLAAAILTTLVGLNAGRLSATFGWRGAGNGRPTPAGIRSSSTAVSTRPATRLGYGQRRGWSGPGRGIGERCGGPAGVAHRRGTGRRRDLSR
jgi:hypothetical protein